MHNFRSKFINSRAWYDPEARMKTANTFTARLQAIAIILSLIVNTTFILPASAKTVDNLDYADSTKLASLETIIYGSSYKYLPSDKRISSLEKILFGKTHSGSLHTRVYALAAAINGSKTDLLAPPVAPELDHSDTATNTPIPPLAPDINASDTLSPLEAQDDRIKVMLQEAMQYYGQGQPDKAESIFKQVLKLDSQNSDANFNLGAIAEQKSDWTSALHYYQIALKSNPDDTETKNAVASMQAKIASNNESSKSNNSSSSKLSPAQITSLKSKVSQAANDYQSGNYDSAISNLEAVLAQAPDQADVYYALAQSYKAKGQYNDAASVLNQAIKLAPNNQDYKDALAQIANQNNQQANAPGDTFANNNPDLAGNPKKSHSKKKGDSDWEEDFTSPQTANNNAPVGEITPFSDAGNSQLGWQPTSEARSSNSYYMPSLSGYMPGYTYSNTIPYTMTYRIERAAIGGLTGAAIGSMFAGRGYRSRGLMTGAMVGGMLGLMGGRW